MVVYIEYAFAQNFLLDGALLWLSFFAARQKIRLRNLLFAGIVGAIFALVFPLLYLPQILLTLLKLFVGVLLCLIAYGKLKTKKDGGRYALICALFLLFTFCVGGALTALFENTPPLVYITPLALLILHFLTVVIRKIYQKRTVHRFLYPCIICYKQKQTHVTGFYDSGNLAIHKGLPVCFLSPDIFYDIFGDEILQKSVGQVCDEVAFSTLLGQKKQCAACAELLIVDNQERYKVYFASSTNMLKREYPLLLSATVNVQGR